VQYLKQTPLPADWNRFDIAATRIRLLTHVQRRGSAISLDIFRCLKVHGKRLHRLRELIWAEPNSDIFPYVDLFLGLHLVQLSLHFPKEPIPGALDLCSSIKNLSPNISILRYTLPRPLSAHPVDELSSLVCSFPQLTMFDANFPVTTEAIKHLSLLPKFTKLTIPNDAGEILKTVTDAGLQQAFASLRTLSLSKASPALCIKFLKLIRPVHLKSLLVRLDPNYVIQAHDMRQLFISVGDLCSHPLLETFTVDFAFNIGEPLTRDILEPLFAFKNLSFVDARTFFSDFDNACLKSLAIAWPNLSSLALKTRPGGSGRSKVCLEGLAELVTRCPGLTTLTIELHVSANNLENWKKTRGDLSNNMLSRLDVGRSTFQCDAGELGRLLRILFPNVKIFVHESDDEPGYNWSDVTRILFGSL
jgi:hypothetical protein